MREGASVTPIVDLTDVSVTYRGQWPRRGTPVTALKNLSLAIPKGGIFGLVGESGSGKSTLGRMILRLQRPDSGRLAVEGRDPFALSGGALKAYRRGVQAVFQDSESSLNPRRSIGATIREGLDIHRIGNLKERTARVHGLLESVGLNAGYAQRLPHTLSGGQRQRVNIARALALEPRILVADEPVSALDVAIQAQILDLFADLHSRLGLTIIFISHDLSVVRAICDRVAVLREGQLIDVGATNGVFVSAPKSPYIRQLLADAPRLTTGPDSPGNPPV